ncbi:exodeoxyribonuclease VII small subunit [Oceanispirochaeta crateris]|uniref:exodeoxyribonuclease VII small subunit n=1 Tax=Oceanispirochaeta crateris TaxID=2518645 RepID=UPI00143DB192|nr:exodeoxyribonuclease VII small subunit [Oceanispirochaeta crateris]
MKFEQKMNRLEEISELIKSGEPEFSQQLELYKEGAVLAEEIEKELEKAELLIQEISEEDQGEN